MSCHVHERASRDQGGAALHGLNADQLWHPLRAKAQRIRDRTTEEETAWLSEFRSRSACRVQQRAAAMSQARQEFKSSVRRCRMRPWRIHAARRVYLTSRPPRLGADPAAVAEPNEGAIATRDASTLIKGSMARYPCVACQEKAPLGEHVSSVVLPNSPATGTVFSVADPLPIRASLSAARHGC